MIKKLKCFNKLLLNIKLQFINTNRLYYKKIQVNKNQKLVSNLFKNSFKFSNYRTIIEW